MILDRREMLAGIGAVAVVVAIPAVGQGAVETFIIPDIMRCEHSRKIVRDNTITHIYEFMNRWIALPNGKWQIEIAKVDSDRYREWVKDIGPDEVMPHIGFGGCVVPDPKGDPTFHPRWIEYAKTLGRS